MVFRVAPALPATTHPAKPSVSHFLERFARDGIPPHDSLEKISQLDPRPPQKGQRHQKKNSGMVMIVSRDPDIANVVHIIHCLLEGHALDFGGIRPLQVRAVEIVEDHKLDLFLGLNPFGV
jgi:hypothetical protein